VTPSLTPALDALSKEGVVFDQAITVAPLTLPAHASLLTGVYPPRHGVRDNQFFQMPADASTYPSAMKAHGYSTSAFVSAVVLDHRYGLNRGFDVYDDEIADVERPAPETLARAERWIDAAARPFFVWIHLFEPHAPYKTGSYEGEVKAVDAALATFFAHLRDRHLWDDLVLSVSSDHGESLGEHREQTHGFFLYDSTVRIPWIVKAPGLQPRRVPHLVRIVDEIPTVIELADPKGSALHVRRVPSDPPNGDGVSLASRLTAGGWSDVGEAYSETFLPRDQFGWSSLASVRTERLKYIEAPRPELYDLSSDPAERVNLASSRADDANRLRRVLGAIAHQGGRSARAPTDPALTAKLQSLGYIASASMPDIKGPPADPKDKIEVYALTMKAIELSEHDDLEGALKAVTQAERLDPNVAQVQFLKGSLLGLAGRFGDAVGALQRTLELDPQYAGARFKLALALLRLGRADRATDALNEAVRDQPDDFRAWHNLATIAYSRGDLDEAERLERKALAISPDYAEAWNALGAIAIVRKQPDAAIDALQKATRLAPQNARAFQNLSLALQAVGRAQEARSALDRACTLDRRYCSTTGGPR
jgi:choline-sulfatase